MISPDVADHVMTRLERNSWRRLKRVEKPNDESLSCNGGTKTNVSACGDSIQALNFFYS